MLPWSDPDRAPPAIVGITIPTPVITMTEIGDHHAEISDHDPEIALITMAETP
jgi:hypothetical protein